MLCCRLVALWQGGECRWNCWLVSLAFCRYHGWDNTETFFSACCSSTAWSGAQDSWEVHWSRYRRTQQMHDRNVFAMLQSLTYSDDGSQAVYATKLPATRNDSSVAWLFPMFCALPLVVTAQLRVHSQRNSMVSGKIFLSSSVPWVWLGLVACRREAHPLDDWFVSFWMWFLSLFTNS